MYFVFFSYVVGFQFDSFESPIPTVSERFPLAEKKGVTEELKVQDQMKWVRLMNNIKVSAEEIILKNMVYV